MSSYLPNIASVDKDETSKKALSDHVHRETSGPHAFDFEISAHFLIRFGGVLSAT
jgi:hypothetical protein